MKAPPFKCLFCLRSDVLFTRAEHPIPESLGNDDWTLPLGFVCDGCNQYFGTKVEKEVLSGPPFIFERLNYVIKSKRGRLPIYKARPGLRLLPSGFKDLILLHAEERYVKHYRSTLGHGPLVIPMPKRSAFYISRFLLKIGLEILLGVSYVNAYSANFDAARKYARYGDGKDKWQVGYAFYPKREDLEISTRYDEFGPIVNRQLYEYGMGMLPSGDISMDFIYGQHVFACNLSKSSIVEHLALFNLHNKITMHFYKEQSTQRIII